MSLFLCYYREVKYYTPISLVINTIQNGFHLPHGPIFFGISSIGFGFLLRYPLDIQGLLAINYIYTTIYTITLHYSYINTLYDTMSLVINAMTGCHCGIHSYLFYLLNYTTPFYKLNTMLAG